MSRPKGLVFSQSLQKLLLLCRISAGFQMRPLCLANSQKEPLGVAIEHTPIPCLLLGLLRTLSYLFVFLKARGVYDPPCTGKKIARFIKVLIKEVKLIKQRVGGNQGATGVWSALL